MEHFASALKREQGKAARIQKKIDEKKKVNFESDPESSDTDESMHNLEEPIPKTKVAKARANLRKAVAKKKKKIEDDAAIEEKAFLKAVVALEDRENRKRKAKTAVFEDEEETSESEQSDN